MTPWQRAKASRRNGAQSPGAPSEAIAAAFGAPVSARPGTRNLLKPNQMYLRFPGCHTNLGYTRQSLGDGERYMPAIMQLLERSHHAW